MLSWAIPLAAAADPTYVSLTAVCAPTDIERIGDRWVVADGDGLLAVAADGTTTPATPGAILPDAATFWAMLRDPDGLDEAAALAGVHPTLPWQAVTATIAGGEPVAWFASASGLVARVAMWAEPVVTQVWTPDLGGRELVDLEWAEAPGRFLILAGPSDSDPHPAVLAWLPGRIPKPVLSLHQPAAALGWSDEEGVVWVVRAEPGCTAIVAPHALDPRSAALAPTDPFAVAVNETCLAPPPPARMARDLPPETRTWAELCGQRVPSADITVSGPGHPEACEITGDDLVLRASGAPLGGPLVLHARHAEIHGLEVSHPSTEPGITVHVAAGGSLEIRDAVVTDTANPSAGIRVRVDEGVGPVVVAGSRVTADPLGIGFHGIDVEVRQHALVSGLWITGNTVRAPGDDASWGSGIRVLGDIDGFVVAGNTVDRFPEEGIDLGVRSTLERPGGDPHRGYVVGNAVTGDRGTGLRLAGVSETCVRANRSTGASTGIALTRPRRADSREVHASANVVSGAEVGMLYDSRSGAGILYAVTGRGNQMALGPDGTIGVRVQRRHQRFAHLWVDDRADAETLLRARAWFAENGVKVAPIEPPAAAEAP